MNDNPDADPNNVHPESQVDACRGLIDELRDRVRSLEKASSENRRIIAALTSRIPAIEAPQEGEGGGASIVRDGHGDANGTRDLGSE